MRSRRRITLVANELRGFHPAGGMGTATTLLALALARMEHTVEILIGWRHSAESIDLYWGNVYARSGIRVRSVRQSDERVEPHQFEVARNVELALRADPPDVVVVHDLGGPAYSALRLRQAGVAFENTLFVVFCHGTRRYILELSQNLAPKDLQELLAVSIHEQASVELADVVVSPSAYLVEWMRNDGWRLPERTLVIPYFTRSTAMGEPVSKPARGDHLQRLAFFGRLDEKKGMKPFAAGLNALEPELLQGLELEFLGKATATWPRDRVESLLSESTKRALRRVSFETELDQHEALARLSRPGTLAVMPSLQDNSPNTVYECLEYGIPFIASNVGGVPELIAAEDRDRVLFEPTSEGVETALRRFLSEGRALRPARASFTSGASYERWADVIEMHPRPQARFAGEALDVIVVRRRSPEALSRCLSTLEQQTYANFRVIVGDGTSVETARQAGLRAGSAPYVIFLDEDDVPDDELLETLVRAQTASGADAVSCGLRLITDQGERVLHFFSGEPEGIGVLSNAYGTVALLRRSLLGEPTGPWPAEADADWPLLAGLAVSGARIVSIPLPLVTRSARPGSIDLDPSDSLLVLEQVERTLPDPLRSIARLVGGLTTNAPTPPADRPAGVLGRARQILRDEGLPELARRALRRLVRGGR